MAVGGSFLPSVESFRWTDSTGLVRLLEGIRNTRATGVSGDGAVVVGTYSTPQTSETLARAFRWTEATGLIDLGVLPNHYDSNATKVSSNGSVIVGYFNADSGGTDAFRWTEVDGMMSLGPGSALSVSGDARIVIVNYQGNQFIWDESYGRRKFFDVLIDGRGLEASLAGWTEQELQTMSPDGQKFVGWGRNPTGQKEAWLAIIPPLRLANDLDSFGQTYTQDFDVLGTVSTNPGTPLPFGWSTNNAGIINTETTIRFPSANVTAGTYNAGSDTDRTLATSNTDREAANAIRFTGSLTGPVDVWAVVMEVRIEA